MRKDNVIYFDNAATTFHKPDEVIESVVFGLKNMGNNGRGVNRVAISTARIIFETREIISNFFNGESSQRICFTSNATEGLNTVIKGLFTENSHIITTEAEHNSVLRPIYELKEKGLEATFLKKEEIFKFNKEKMKKYIRSNTKAVICTHASNLTGDITDIGNIGEFCKENGLLFILDASQSAGIIPIDVKKSNIDVLCFTGHKALMGPQGTGGIYVKEGIEVAPLKTGGSGMETYNEKHPRSMPERLEAGTLNGHGIIGLKAGIEYINRIGIENIHKRETDLMWKFYDGIKDIEKIRIYGNFIENGKKIKRTPIVSINIGEADSGDLCDFLSSEYGIITRAGGHCAPLMHKSLGTDKQGVVRFSFSYFNTEQEIDKTVEILKQLAKEI